MRLESGVRCKRSPLPKMLPSFAESTSCCVWCASLARLPSYCFPTDAEQAPQPNRTGAHTHLRDDTPMRLPRQIQHMHPAALEGAAPSQQVGRLPARESSTNAVEHHSTTQDLHVDGSSREGTMGLLL